MNPRYRVVRLGLCIVGAMLCAQPAARGQSYILTDLGTLEGGPGSVAYAVNDAGHVVGSSRLPPNGFIIRPFLWVDGTLTDLGSLGGITSIAFGINNSDQVVGSSNLPSGFTHAFLWEDGQMIDLGTPFGSGSVARDINDAGQITGVMDSIAFIWEDGIWTELGTLPGFTQSVGLGINEAGEVAGTALSFCFCGNQAFHWVDGVMTGLEDLPGFDGSVPWALNNTGILAGHSAITIPSVLRATLWESGQPVDLGSLDASGSEALGINDAGQVVGYYGNGNQFLNHYACKWENLELIDLNEVIPPDSGWVLHEANDINESGQIVGAGFNPDGQGRGFLLTPCAPADFNCDEDIGAFDLAQLLASWGECDDCENCAADLNDDCEVGATDLATLLASWGPL